MLSIRDEAQGPGRTAGHGARHWWLAECSGAPPVPTWAPADGWEEAEASEQGRNGKGEVEAAIDRVRSCKHS